MSAPLASARPTDPLEEVIATMRANGVRRIPILEDGRPVGMVTLDDLLVALGHELDRLADCVAGEVRRARMGFDPARVRQEVEGRIEEVATRLLDVGDQTLRIVGRELDQVMDRVVQAIRTGGPRPTGAAFSVGDLMQIEVWTCTPEDPLREPARIMWEHDCGCVPVVASDGSGRVVGVITDRDICMASYTSGGRLSEVPVRSAMAERVVSCRPEDPLSEACATMRKARVRRLPVVDEHGRLRGVLSLADLAEAAAGIRAPGGAVSASDVGGALAEICRPRSLRART